jgi:hypothetical protein
MGIVPVSFHAEHERSTLQAFADLLPYFDDPLIRGMAQRSRSFDEGALEYVGRGGIYAVLCQSFVDGEDALVSTVAVVDAAMLDEMTHGRGLRPPVSLSSYTGTAYPGIQAILGSLGTAVARRLEEHEANPSLRADFDWCVAIERRRVVRARTVGTTVDMIPALARAAGRLAA